MAPTPKTGALPESSSCSGGSSSSSTAQNQQQTVNAPNVPPPKEALVEPKAQPARDEIDEWLAGLGNTGVMLRYSEAVHREFETVSELTAAIVDPAAKGIKIAEPSIWATLGITSLGHKLSFSGGLRKLGGLPES